MPKNNVDYELLLTDNFRDNEFWTDLTATMGAVTNPIIQNAIEALSTIRSINIEPYYASLNIQTLGFKVPFLAFTPIEYQRLMKYVGTFVQTRGASVKFIDFVAFIKNVKFEHIPLWSNDITNIDSLSNTFGTPVWQGGEWFPTSFYDVEYDMGLFSINEEQIKYMFLVLEPIHLVLRNLIGVYRFSGTIQFTPYVFSIVHDYAYTSR